MLFTENQRATLQTQANESPEQVSCNLACKGQFLGCVHPPTSVTGAALLQVQLGGCGCSRVVVTP